MMVTNTEARLSDLVEQARALPPGSAAHTRCTEQIAVLISEPAGRRVFDRLIAKTPHKRSEAPAPIQTPALGPKVAEKASQGALGASTTTTQPANSTDRFERPERRVPKPRVMGSMGTERDRPSFPRADIWDIWMKND